MRKYQTSDGETLEAETSRGIIKKLRALSHEPEANLPAFMKAVAGRVLVQTGDRVPTRSEADFVLGLIKAGLLKEIVS